MWTFSVEYNGAAVATVLAFSSPAMTAVLAHYLLGENITGIKLISIALSLVGTVLVSGAADPATWKVNAAGIAFGLLTGLFFAIYNMVGKSSANRSIDPWSTMLYGFSYAVGFLLLFNIAVSLRGWAGRRSPTCSGWETRGAAGPSCCCWALDQRSAATACIWSAWATCLPRLPI